MRITPHSCSTPQCDGKVPAVPYEAGFRKCETCSVSDLRLDFKIPGQEALDRRHALKLRSLVQ